MPAAAAEIPIWINGAQRWISGIGRKTTCDDVIRVLLRSEGCHADTIKDEKHHGKHYAIVERWKKVERPLDGRARILKVWSAWGDEQEAVRLTLKRVNPTTPRDVKTHHHRRSSRSGGGHNRARLLQTVHPNKRLVDSTSAGGDNKIEHLMKLILAQGETIHSQLRRLHEREEQIINIEDQVHSARVERLGSNYLLETYLKDLDANKGGEDDSGVAEEPQPTGSSKDDEAEQQEEVEEREDEDGGEESQSALVELRACIALWERVVRVNKRLEKEEQVLVKLNVKLRRLSEKEAPALDATEMITNEAAAILQDQLDEAEALTAAHQMETEQNEVMLQESCEQLQERHRLLDYLQEELRESELEEEQLKRWLHEALYKKHQQLQQQQQQHHALLTKQLSQQNQVLSTTPSPSSSTGAIKKQFEGDTDSNSDTGLSSLHSSTEEGVYVLDTLV
jgi:Ras association domain-containing protein 9/10